METDPTKDEQQTEPKNPTGDEPGTTEGPGNVTVDEPTDPALSGTAPDDFGDDAEGDEKS